jgi:triosephosphate isomerase
MRRPIIAGNWKMNKTCAEAVSFLDELKPLLSDVQGVEVLICPPYTALSACQSVLNGSGIGVGAQDVFWKKSGAYTGQVAPNMLTELGIHYVIVGHSETRGRFGVPEPDFTPNVLAHFGDTDETVNRKLHATLTANMIPICCVGETIDERKAGKTDTLVSEQVVRALVGVEESAAASIVLAYEPVWAIGTGEVCGAEEADRVCGVIRATVERLYGERTAAHIRIQYGGSVKPDNAEELLGQPQIDGALVGGASLKTKDFAAIVLAASQK